MKEPFKWDHYSDQPALLQDKKYKKLMRKKELFSIAKTFFTALLVLPLSLFFIPYVKRKKINSKDFFCLGVDFQREPTLSLQAIDELKVQHILTRIKLWELDQLSDLKTFLKKTTNKKVTLKILQDRENIEDLELFEKNLRTIFTQLDGLVDIFEIGSTINRSKWGFFSVSEYNSFYKVAYDLQQKEFPKFHLIGSGVIDFEFHFTAHTLFNFSKHRFDGVSSLLYVDRRGAPENSQMGFNLSDKIAWLSTLTWLSPKSKNEVHITETNWPLSGTAPYAPTSEYECIDEKSYADFMVRYYLLAFASQQINSVSWHQLIARGYGLIDNIDAMNYRPAYNTYKFMLENLLESQFLRLDIKRDYYIFQCLVNDKLLQIHWSMHDTHLKNEEHYTVFSRDGEKIEDRDIPIGSSPVYIYINKAVSEKVNCL